MYTRPELMPNLALEDIFERSDADQLIADRAVSFCR
jgi:hypothetical protein